DFLIGLLPSYILENDSYKVGGKGFVERYLSIFGDEWDEQFLGFIQDFVDILGPYSTDEKYLEYLEDLQGDIENYTDTEQHRRKVISYIISIYNVKGTKKSITQVLAIMGIKVVSIEIQTTPISAYDTIGVFYDADPPFLYDASSCSLCSTINITGTYLGGFGLTEDQQIIVEKLIELVLPINLTFGELIIDSALSPELSAVSVDYNEIVVQWNEGPGVGTILERSEDLGEYIQLNGIIEDESYTDEDL